MAVRAASCVRLRRPMPKVAGTDAATLRARSSAAPRDEPTMRTRVPGGHARRRSRADASRSAADAEIQTRRDEDRRSEEHTSELQSQSNLVCRLLLEKKKK